MLAKILKSPFIKTRFVSYANADRKNVLHKSCRIHNTSFVNKKYTNSHLFSNGNNS